MPSIPAINSFISVEDYIEGELHSQIRFDCLDFMVTVDAIYDDLDLTSLSWRP
jgi:hypothetical protein